MSAPQSERKPVVHEMEMITAPVTVSARVEGSVERGLNETRLAVLGIVVAIGLTVGLGFDATWWIGVLAGAGSFLFSCFVIRFRPARRQLMSFMHWLTGS
jgi:hypothetical protein